MKTGALRIERVKTKNVCEKVVERLPFLRFGRAIPELVGDDIALADLFIALLFSVGFGDIHESGGERVVGDEGGGKADDGK